MILKTTMKKITVTVILFYVVLFIGLALYDERPNTAMVSEMDRPFPETIEPGNAWVVFIGFAAPKDIAPYNWGKEKLQKWKKALLSKGNIEEVLLNDLDLKRETSFYGKRPSFYGTKDKGVLGYMQANKTEADRLARNNRELLHRYESLITYKRYNEDYDHYMPFPSFSRIRDAQAVYLLQLAGKANQGDLSGALRGLVKDIDFWRTVARNSTTLISKLFACSYLNTDFHFAAELGTVRTLNAKELALVRDILRPLDNGEIAMSKAFQGEGRYIYKSMEWSTRQHSLSLDNLFFKRNATSNRMYADFQAYIRLAELPAQKFAAEVKKREGENNGMRKIGFSFLYNPAGEILSVIGQSQGIPKYIERGYNLEGFRRLAWLKVLIKTENVPPEQVQQFLDAHTSDFGNPYTNGPMKWDLKKGSIFFNDLSDDKAVEILL